MIYIILGVIVVIIFVVAIASNESIALTKEKPKYQYKHKDFFISKAEHEFYNILVTTVGQEYRIFAQVHLPTIVDHKIKGQNWSAALSHINQKSVDFVLCDKAYLSPKLAIELDDKSHERPERKERDHDVELILSQSGLPLLRIKNQYSYNPSELTKQIKEAINNHEDKQPS